MKMEMKTTGWVLVMLILFAATGTYAQGRGKGHDKHSHKRGHDRHYEYDHGHAHPAHRVSYHHYERPVVVHHHHTVPWVHARRANARYVYFKDYNVYYDYRRSVYLTLSGRNWVVSADLPLPMRHVDVRRVVYTDVDYRGDDLYYYHTSHHVHCGPYCCR